ncbi:MAG: hypothetical protein KGZ43_02360 [Sulfuritalea sp.]|nr:hypothetical protein [Sulfuritalea sp.]
MSQNKSPTTQTEQNPGNAINPGRRRLGRAALAAPVVVSLASKNALAGGNCLSNMLSGNLSDPKRGQCSKGWSPGGWGLPGGNVSSFSTIGAWQVAGFSYGSYSATTAQCHPQNANKPECYVGGSTVAHIPAVLNQNGVPAATPLRVVLLPNLWPAAAGWQLTRHLVCAYLNASLSENSDFNYVMTKQQVVGLASGTIPLPPGYTSLQAFLDSTW